MATKKQQSIAKELIKINPFFQDALNPNHYKVFKIQVMEFCHVNRLGYCEGHIVRYVCRAEMKNGLEDLKKAMEYLKCLIYYKETGVFKTPDKIKKLKRSWR